ncbi:MAG: T9SS type A sorting domain-containing protein [Bacteroidota bacterium]
MKNRFTYRIKLFAFACFASLLLAQPLRACLDYHTTVFITCHYDDPTFNEIAITVSNLRLFGGNPNDFCSCGITNYTNLFNQIQYIAFVDSGTTNPLAGFDVWTPDANSTNAWESVLATGDWNGFVSSVNGNGLPANTKVELIIRASLPPGYTYSILDSNVVATQLGTDEWDNTNQNLANTHQSVTGFWTGGSPQLIAEPANSTYFQDLDNSILLSAEGPKNQAYLEVGPIPASDHLRLRLKNPHLFLDAAEIYNAAGQQVARVPLSVLHSGEAEIAVYDYPEGIYFLRVHTANGNQTKKFMILH